MKKMALLTGMLVMLLVFGMTVVGCASTVTFDTIQVSSTPTPFEGVWAHPNPDSLNAKIVFFGNSFSYTWDTGSRNGRFTTSGRNITFFTDDGKKWATTYTLNNEYLRLEQGRDGWHWYGSFLEVDSDQSISLDGSWKHPIPQAQGATYTFTGNQFVYNRDNGFNASGNYTRNGNKLTITVDEKIVREYTCYFRNKGTAIYLIGLSGDGDNYFQGPFDKQ